MARQLKTSYPFPSSPSRHPAFNIRFDGPGKFSIHAFCEIYAGKAFLDAVLGEDEFTWVDENTIIVRTTELRIHSTHLEQLMEAPSTDYQLPMPYSGYAAVLSSKVRPRPEPRKFAPSQASAEGVSLQELADEFSIEPRKVRSVLRRRMNKSAPWTFNEEELARARTILARDC